jgi:hypothetical protein
VKRLIQNKLGTNPHNIVLTRDGYVAGQYPILKRDLTERFCRQLHLMDVETAAAPTPQKILQSQHSSSQLLKSVSEFGTQVGVFLTLFNHRAHYYFPSM